MAGALVAQALRPAAGLGRTWPLVRRALWGLLGAVASGVLLATAQRQVDSPWPWPLLAVAWVPWLASLPASAFGAWALTGLVHALMMLPLIGGVASAVGLSLGLPVMAVVAGLCALPALAAPALVVRWGAVWGRGAVLLGLVALDALRARSWVSWVGLGDALGESPVAAPVLAQLGVTGALLLLMGLNMLWWLVLHTRSPRWRGACLAVAALGTWGPGQPAPPSVVALAPSGGLRVALVAPGIAADEADGDLQKMERLLQAYRQLQPSEVDLVLMPQSSLNGLSPSDPALRAELLAAVAAQGIPLLAGSEERLPDHHWERPHQHNAAFLALPPPRDAMVPAAPTLQWQAKLRPVPWTEYWPETLRHLPLGGLEQRQAPYVPGTVSRPLVLDRPTMPVRLGVMLCYDAYNPRIAQGLQAQGSQVLIVLSSDESFSGSALSRQGLRMARLRGMSLGLPVIRVAWSAAGTGAYDAQGRTLPAQPLAQPVPGVTLWHVPMPAPAARTPQ